MPEMVDLSKYAIFETPQLETRKVYNAPDDYEAVERFNKSMAEVHRDYSAKEKLSCISAKKISVDRLEINPLVKDVAIIT